MNPLFMLLVGIVVGITLTLGLGVAFMRARMIRSHPAARSFEDTCATLEQVVEAAEGWSLPLGSWDAHAVLEKKGLVPDNLARLRFYFLCNASHASRLLGAVPSLSGMMPCSWAIPEPLWPREMSPPLGRDGCLRPPGSGNLDIPARPPSMAPGPP